jgi:hypothetical protein
MFVPGQRPSLYRNKGDISTSLPVNLAFYIGL